MNALLHRSRSNHAFTLADLLVTVATLAVLAMIVLPAIGGIQNKGGRFQCANNLRQIGTATMIYAGENHGWLPICTVGAGNTGGKFNNLWSLEYTCYVFFGATSNMRIPTNTPTEATNQNAGYLYLFEDGLAGNGSIFYCPDQWGNATFGANAFTPLLTANSSGSVISSYFYNPRMANAFTGNTLRRYQKTSQLEPHRLLSMDVLISNSSGGVNLASVPHLREYGGWNVLFTDGSVQFCWITNRALLNSISQDLSLNESAVSYQGYDTVFTGLEQAH